MILLDTDHLSVLTDARHSRHGSLMARLAGSPDQDIRLPIVSVEEQLRGWLAHIHGVKAPVKQVGAYARLEAFLSHLRPGQIAPFDDRAAVEFNRLRAARLRVGTQDLKIASITLVQDALLLSANLRDYRLVPSLRVEDWLTDPSPGVS
jgi:tRNA(fMet)-specific endonuclease VapC